MHERTIARATFCGVGSAMSACGGGSDAGSGPSPSAGVASVVVAPSEASLAVGATLPLSATVLDRNGTPLPGTRALLDQRGSL